MRMIDSFSSAPDLISEFKDGLYFLQLMKWGVLQYCVIRPTLAFMAY